MDHLDRFLSKTKLEPNGCLIWQAGKDPEGYGIFSAGGVCYRAHRWIYQQVFGPLPSPKVVLDHLRCSNPSCCNPMHMLPSTNQQNLLRGDTVNAANMAKEFCIHGHPFDETNTGWVNNPRHRGARRCRTCGRERMRRYRAERKGA